MMSVIQQSQLELNYCLPQRAYVFSVICQKKQKTHTDPIGAEEELLSGSDHGADTQIMFWLSIDRQGYTVAVFTDFL